MSSHGKQALLKIRSCKGYLPYILAIVSCVYLVRCSVDSDAWFLLNCGRYVEIYGIPYTDPFTFHAGLHYVMQQWLFAFLLWKLYTFFGIGGLITYAHIICVVFVLAEAFLVWTVSNKNRFLTLAFALSFGFLFDSQWLATQRPWTISLLVFLLEIWLLERYRTRQPKWMAFAFFALSIFCVNIHAATWPMLFILALPYLAEAVLHNRLASFIPMEEGWGIRPLCILLSVMLLGGFLNPYGWEGMQYGLISYGHPSISTCVLEMAPASLKSAYGLFTIPSTIALAIFYTRHPVLIRFLLLSAGTALMGLLASRNLAFFVLFGFLGVAWHFRSRRVSGCPIPNVAFYFLILVTAVLLSLSHDVLWKTLQEQPLIFLLYFGVPLLCAACFHRVRWFCYFSIFLLMWMPGALRISNRPPVSPHLQEAVLIIQQENPQAKVLTDYGNGG